MCVLGPRKGFLGLRLYFWDHPHPLLPPSEDEFSPFFLFGALGFFCRTRAGLEPGLLDTMSCCSPAVALGAAGSSDLPAASKPHCCRAVGGKNGLFQQFLSGICKVEASSSHTLLFYTFLLGILDPEDDCSLGSLLVTDGSISRSHHLLGLL